MQLVAQQAVATPDSWRRDATCPFGQVAALCSEGSRLYSHTYGWMVRRKRYTVGATQDGSPAASLMQQAVCAGMAP